MARMQGGGVDVDLSTLRKEIEKVAEDSKKAVAEFGRKRLQSFIDELNAKSSKRASTLRSHGLTVNEGSVDTPFANAKAVVRKNGDKYTIEVEMPGSEHNLFDLLDQGIPARYVKDAKAMRFPIFTGHLTTPGTLKVSGTTRFSGQWITARKVGSAPPRLFYLALIWYMRDNWDDIAKGLPSAQQGAIRSFLNWATGKKVSVKKSEVVLTLTK